MHLESPSGMFHGLPQAVVDTDESRRAAFRQDLTEEMGLPPEAIFRPRTDEEVAACIRVAGSAGVRLLPVVANTNVGGLSVPRRARSVVLDLGALNRIVELNRRDRYVVLEPGVSWQMLKDRLDRDAPELRFGYPLAPPESSVLAGCLLDGLGNLSLRYGSMGSWLNGVEAVLPDGSRVTTGTRAWAPGAPWCCRGPLPDLTGLFVSVQGATGVVVRAAVQLRRNPPVRRRFFLLCPEVGAGMDTLEALAGEEVCDDLASLSWPLGRLLLEGDPRSPRDPADPALFLYLDLSGEDEGEADYREARIHRILRRGGFDPDETLLPIGWVVGLDPAFAQLAEFPTRLGFLLDHPGGGLSWLGTYGPISRWREGADRGLRRMEEAGFPPALVARPMAGGHFCVLRWVVTFDRGNPEERGRVRALLESLLDLVLDLGFLPYKTPRWALERCASRMQPGFRDLLARMTQSLDPLDVLDGSRWRSGGKAPVTTDAEPSA